MNWKLIFGLSLFGMAMAFATVYWISMSVEPFIWIAILLLCAALIAKNATGHYFLHGFLVCLLNCVWITSAHIILSDTYLKSHAQEMAQYVELNKKYGITMTQAMLVMGPIIGIASGLALGLFSFVAAKILKKQHHL